MRKYGIDRRPARIALIVLQIALVLSLAPWALITMFTPMAFDSGPRLGGPMWAILIAIWTYPLDVIAASAVAWILYARQRHGGAVIAACAPFAVVAAIVLVVAVASA